MCEVTYVHGRLWFKGSATSVLHSRTFCAITSRVTCATPSSSHYLAQRDGTRYLYYFTRMYLVNYISSSYIFLEEAPPLWICMNGRKWGFVYGKLLRVGKGEICSAGNVYSRQNLVVKSNYRWTMNTNQARDNSKHMACVYWWFLSRHKTTGLANFVKSI